MKLYTFAALICVIAVSTLILTSCTTEVMVTPTPFKTGKTVQPLQGCLDLRKSVEEHNKQNPNDKLEADC
jgi:hypothetical protein